jgi:hypothetical protein
MHDTQGDVARSIYAQQVDFDRARGVIHVLGSPQRQVHIYETRENQDSQMLVGEEFTIDLHTNTLRAGATQGEFRQR